MQYGWIGEAGSAIDEHRAEGGVSFGITADSSHGLFRIQQNQSVYLVYYAISQVV